MKKSKLIALAVVLILIFSILALTFSIIHKWDYYTHDVGGYDIDNFKSYKKDFQTIAEKVISFYEEETENNPELAYIVIEGNPIDTWEVECVTETERTDSYKEATEEESQAYTRISRAFTTDSGGLLFIKVTEDRVLFHSATHYAIVYMRNGKRPKYITDKNEGYDSIFVDRLSYKWYQVMGK